MPSPTLTRRAIIAGAGTAVASAALAVPYVNAARSEEVCSLPIDPDTDGLIGLPLAAVHIERAVAAMASVTFGRWEVTITSGDADQYWGFKQVGQKVGVNDPLASAIADYRVGQKAYNGHPIDLQKAGA